MALVDRGFRRHGLNVDVIDSETDFGRYRAVVAPTLHVVSTELAMKLERFVNSGGVLVLSARSGYKNVDNLAIEQPPPGPLRKLAGLRVRQFASLQEPHPPTLLGFAPERGTNLGTPENEISGERDEWRGRYTARVWADLLEPEGAQVLFRYTKDALAGEPAVTLFQYGRGKVIYVGPLLEPQFYTDLAARACRWAGIPMGPDIPDGVDYTVRVQGEREYRFLMNFAGESREVRFPTRSRDLLTGEAMGEPVVVPPLGVRILVKE